MSDESEEDIIKLLGRGSTPENIEERCFKLCQQYLGGAWLNLTIDKVNVKRLRGGLTNQLYYCAINEEYQVSNRKEPQEVAVLLYGHIFYKELDNETNNQRLNGNIIALIVSENGLGPKIYGLFEGGQIMKYYKHKSFRSEQHNDVKLIEEVSRRLARVHAMDVPIKKTGNWLIDYFNDTYKLANDRFNLRQLIDESESETLKAYDVGQELEWIKKVVLVSKCPETFTHADYRGANIMITESGQIVLCDFELSCYGYRGFDFGTIFCEWGRLWGQWDDPHQFPSDETFQLFIDSYIEESVKLKGTEFSEDKRNSFENILKEVKIFTLVGYMWIVLFLLAKDESFIPDIEFNKLELMVATEKLYKNAYHQCKRTLLGQKLLKDVIDLNE